MVPSGKPKLLIVATFEHFAPNAADISNSIESNGLMLVMLRSRTGICGSVGRRSSYQVLTSSKVASRISKVSFSTL